MKRNAPLAIVVSLALGACAGARPAPDGPPPDYPGGLVAPAELQSPDALGGAFALEQRVRTEYPEGAQEFRAVLQLRGDTMVLVGFGPHGGRGFVLSHTGEDVSFESYLPEELPFPPEFMLQDVQRTWFRGLSGSRPDGVHSELVGDETIEERWQDGRLMERTFERTDGPPDGVIRVSYGERGLGGSEPPERVEMDNAWFGYRLILTTLSHQRIDEPPPETEHSIEPAAGPEPGTAETETDAEPEAEDAAP